MVQQGPQAAPLSWEDPPEERADSTRMQMGSQFIRRTRKKKGSSTMRLLVPKKSVLTACWGGRDGARVGYQLGGCGSNSLLSNGLLGLEPDG